MTAKCPTDLDVQNLNSTHPCGHFDTYLAYTAQSGQTLQHVEIRSKMHTSKIENFRFGPTVQCIWYISLEHFTIYQDIYEDQENTYMLGSDT